MKGMDESFGDRIKRYRNIAMMEDPESGVNRYRIVPFFDGTSFEGQGTGIKYPIFRSFVPIKPSSGRVMRGDDFDMYTNTLFDYPHIISSKLDKPWQHYNFLISVHVAACPLDCWYCYVDECLRKECQDCGFSDAPGCINAKSRFDRNMYTAKEIAELFLIEYGSDKGRKRVLRITGGEPFLVPELLLEVLTLIQERGLDDEIFVWTETNLTPFIKDDETEKRFFETFSDVRIDDLKKFNNWALHPCLHGSSTSNFLLQTGSRIEFNKLLDALFYLCDQSLDIYPTISSNLCPNYEMEQLFDELNRRFVNLPLRVALIESDMRYAPILNRILHGVVHEAKLYNKWLNIYSWNEKCKSVCGYKYAEIGREKVIYGENIVAIEKNERSTIPSKKTTEEAVAKDGDYVYIFKSCYRDIYKQELISILALPTNTIYQLEYREDLLHPSFIEWLRIQGKKLQGRAGIIIYMDREETGTDRFVPLRKFTIENILLTYGLATLWIELGDYVLKHENFDEGIQNIIGEDNLPIGNQSGDHWIFTAEKLHSGCFRIGEKEEAFTKIVDELAGIDRAQLRNDWRNVCFVMIRNPERRSKRGWRIRNSEGIAPENVARYGDHRETGYILRNNRSYSLPMHLYNPHFDSISDDLKKEAIVAKPGTRNTKFGSRNMIYAAKNKEARFDFDVDDVVIRNVEGEIRICSEKPSYDHLDVIIRTKLKRNILNLVIALTGIILGILLLVLPTSFDMESVIITATNIGGILLIIIAVMYYTGKIFVP